jgi:NAD(P)-dependent dehydrogenase (short-subunit alcohol dehydrogenase family)
MSLAALDARFPNRRAVITGGASGLGLAAAELLAARGWRIALLDRDEPRLTSAAEALPRDGQPALRGHPPSTPPTSPAVTFAIDAFAGRLGGLDLALNLRGCRGRGRPRRDAAR